MLTYEVEAGPFILSNGENSLKMSRSIHAAGDIVMTEAIDTGNRLKLFSSQRTGYKHFRHTAGRPRIRHCSSRRFDFEFELLPYRAQVGSARARRSTFRGRAQPVLLLTPPGLPVSPKEPANVAT